MTTDVTAAAAATHEAFTAPDCELIAPGGERVALSALYETRPLLLVFLGDLSNPFTSDNAAQLRDGLEAVEDAGADLAAVTSAPPAQAASFAAKWRLTYPLLSDPGHATFKGFSVDGPGAFVIDTAGVVRFARRAANSADYPPMTVLLEPICAITGAEMPIREPEPAFVAGAAPLSGGARAVAAYAAHTCAKCGYGDFERNQLSTAGGWISRFFNFQNRRFIAVSCRGCGYTELYKQGASALSNIVDIFGAG